MMQTHMQSQSACPTCGKPKGSIEASCKKISPSPGAGTPILTTSTPADERAADGARFVSILEGLQENDSADSRSTKDDPPSQKQKSARKTKEPIKATDIDKNPTERQLKVARTKMLKVLLPSRQEDWAGPILHAFPSFRKLALASRADLGKILKGKKREQISQELARRLYYVFH